MKTNEGLRSGIERLLFRGKTKVESAGLCQVGGGTGHPCHEVAAREIRGVRFCERCARKQELYALIGDLAQSEGLVSDWLRQARDLENEPLVEALGRLETDFGWRMLEARRRLREVERVARGAAS